MKSGARYVYFFIRQTTTISESKHFSSLLFTVLLQFLELIAFAALAYTEKKREEEMILLPLLQVAILGMLTNLILYLVLELALSSSEASCLSLIHYNM